MTGNVKRSMVFTTAISNPEGDAEAPLAICGRNEIVSSNLPEIPQCEEPNPSGGMVFWGLWAGCQFGRTRLRVPKGEVHDVALTPHNDVGCQRGWLPDMIRGGKRVQLFFRVAAHTL